MASFNTILEDVYTLTKRRDLEAYTKMAIKAATLKLHSRDFYPRDKFETGISFDTSSQVQSLEHALVIPRFRKWDYLRKSDANGTLGTFFSLLEPSDSLDRYNVNKENIAYLAGVYTHIRSSEVFQYLIAGCYRYPDTMETSYDSWIADEQPFAIIIESAKTIQSFVGNTEIVASLENAMLEQYAILNQYITA